MEEMKRKEFYRDAVKRRAVEMEEGFKLATMGKLEQKEKKGPQTYRYSPSKAH
jgi:hypothetical protein